MKWQELKKPLTPWGYAKLAEEHRELLEEQRPKVVEGIAIAAAEGDRSENAEYIYGKKRLREIDKRLRYLSSLIDDVQIVNPENYKSDLVFFGATVALRFDDGREVSYAIVGAGECDADKGTISWKSPLAFSLRDKKAGDFVEFMRPKGETEVEILSITYKSLADKF